MFILLSSTIRIFLPLRLSKEELLVSLSSFPSNMFPIFSSLIIFWEIITWYWVPLPGSLTNFISPPSILTSLLAIIRPSVVLSMLFWVLLPSFTKSLKSFSKSSIFIACPVFKTAKSKLNISLSFVPPTFKVTLP